MCLEDGWSDAVTFIDGKGRDKLSTYRDVWCPWMRTRPLATLREVLGFWKMLVIDGIWSVDAQGVVEGTEYFDDIKDSKIIAVEGKEVKVRFRASWDAPPAF